MREETATQLAEQPATTEEATPPVEVAQETEAAPLTDAEVQQAVSEADAVISAAEASTNTNINNLSLGDQVDDYEPEADIDTIVLPPEDIHTLKLRAGKKGVYGPDTDKDGNPLSQPKLDKNNRAFFVAELEVILVSENPKYDGIRIFNFKDALMNGIYATSQVSQRNPTSAAADIANKTGYPFRKGATLSQNRAHLEELLASEPTIQGMIQWQATKETGETDENGYPVRVIAKRGMKQFPPLVIDGQVQMENGVALHDARMQDTDGTELVARAVVTRFLPVSS